MVQCEHEALVEQMTFAGTTDLVCAACGSTLGQEVKSGQGWIAQFSRAAD